MYKSGPYTVYKPCAKTRRKLNIEVGVETFGVGIHRKRMRSTSLIGPHWQKVDDEDQDEVVIMDDGKILMMLEYKDN